MSEALAEKTIAIIAANGFNENDMTAIQRSLTQQKATYKVIAPEQGLVNGWQDNAWGHYFTVDVIIGGALGSDFDALVLVGGERGIAKLKQNLHTRRIVNHFLEAGKPVAAIGAAVELLTLSAKSANRTVAVALTMPAETQAALKAAGMIVNQTTQEQDANLLTADGSAVEAWAEATVQLFTAEAQMAAGELVAA